MNHIESFICVLIHFRAVWHPLLGLNPCDWLLKFNSNMGSIIVLTTSCTSLSFIAGIPRGLFFPGFPGLGIMTSLTPTQSYSLLITICFISSILAFVNVSIPLRSGAGLPDPLFFFNLRYAANHRLFNLSSPLRLLNVLPRFL